ncbi:cytochrome c oxidase assembly protein [Novosphingobium sp. G106]|uniref:cytochrome c oxidase assembly protein n=1 Tax=Novosphingobium sp. G106 TaxID=2849500 RepID=UPI001C2D24B8|nr:cytochrome c oxidase assembly protein [Novosphingobium sp. G106]MBV1691361.1 cytochrome c oxidase assembly protein [Novosphingobium sp. G106]
MHPLMNPSGGVSGSAKITPACGVPMAIVAVSAVLWWLCEYHAAGLPFLAPWDFSFVGFYGLVFPVWWYVRGTALTEQAKLPSAWRTASFIMGIGTIYIVLLTRFEYLAEHMFFLNRLQHVVMHHLGPLLIALAWPWQMILSGMPQGVRRIAEGQLALRILGLMRRPWLAGSLFVGLIALWLVPSVHFRAMIDPKLYWAMNGSMVIDGIFFWSLVLDPREPSMAEVSWGARGALAIGIMFPQILVGAIIALSSRDLYSFYAWCGRIYPTVSPLDDQALGGLIVWIPPAMMSVISLLLVLNALRRCEERTGPELEEGFSSSSWTGRP